MNQKSDASTRPATLAEGVGTLDVGAKLAAGQRLGPYRLVRQLGEGGMGVVWLADQLQPFERKVAIKLSNRQSGSNMANAYFEIERQALAQLVHPYIAQIYDAGMRSDGMLYFAMEYVEGSTLDEFLVDKPVSLDACIGLLAQVCQGAHYAHQRGLIHRDLKPGNVLIAEVSGSPMPKIIDFGIAIGVDIARTGSGASAGTRAYMAPEQFNASNSGLDLRADVYALGAILIEALCLQLKIPLDGVDSGTFRGLLSAAGTSANPISQTAHVPAALRGELRRIPKSLRAIAIKALSEDRDARYESAAAMADDLKRWRERRPVLAMQGGKLYALRCFVNRYRLVSALGAATIAALIGGLIIAGYGLREATIAKAQAELRREQAESLVDYMLGDFAAKLEPIGKLDLIDGVASRALEYLQQANDSDLSSAIHRAAALRTIGDVQTRRGQWTQAKTTFALAEQVLTKAQAANRNQITPELLFEQGQVAYWIGYTYYSERDFDTAKIHWQRYLDIAMRLKPLTVESGIGEREVGYALTNLGSLAFQIGEPKTAQDYFLRAIKIGEDQASKEPNTENGLLDLSKTISWLARSYEASGDLRGAQSSYQKQLDISERMKAKNPNNAVWTDRAANSLYWLGTTNLQLGLQEEAISALRAAVSELEGLRLIDATNLELRSILGFAQSELAWALHLKDRHELALEVIEDYIDEFTINFSSSSPLKDKRTYASSQVRKSIILRAIGRLDEAQASYDFGSSELIRLNKNNPNDRKIAIALAVCLTQDPRPENLISNATRAKALLLPLVEKQADAETLDAFVRASVLLGDNEQAQAFEAQLNAIQYNHPNYRAFLARHRKGDSP